MDGSARPDRDTRPAGARTVDIVRIAITGGEDRRQIQDLLWDDAAYRADFAAAELELLATHRPLGRRDEPYPWRTELDMSPWLQYILG